MSKLHSSPGTAAHSDEVAHPVRRKWPGQSDEVAHPFRGMWPTPRSEATLGAWVHASAVSGEGVSGLCRRMDSPFRVMV